MDPTPTTPSALTYLPEPDRRPAAWGLFWLFLGWALASWLRHGLVEPALLTARCDAIVWSQVWAQGVWSQWASIDGACLVRATTVQVFVNHRLATVALAVAVLALVLRRRWLAGVALFLGAAALVLYSTDRGTLAVLLAGWVWVSPPAAAQRTASRT